ncbi:ABC transporter permease [Cohnella herbarum]|uniref:ABC transporter permease n=1 Tax=Cohnella herbarum TaxID=2728023 RepID=A0A7Z2VH62_9BACL|nr:ABC transporter permease [Cohnella herbarum]QJD83012.1 ABC transporter permease [Cohnella herbarum]
MARGVYSGVQLKPSLRINRRKRALYTVVAIVGFLILIVSSAMVMGDNRLTTNLGNRNLQPSLSHLFGTDWLGRDMFARTVKGLTLSIGVGMLAAVCSAFIATAVGLAAALLGKTADRFFSWLIDLFLSVPHLVTLILIAFVSGGGVRGVIIGVALTHWPSLSRIIRAEVLQLRSAEFIKVSKRLGKSSWWIATRHLMPHLVPQLLIGVLLLFPHAILHEASITFLGLGLSPHQPAIGIILSEAMRYLSTGMWWLAVFPGLGLLVVVRMFDRLGDRLRTLIDPRHAND